MDHRDSPCVSISDCNVKLCYNSNHFDSSIEEIPQAMVETTRTMTDPLHQNCDPFSSQDIFSDVSFENVSESLPNADSNYCSINVANCFCTLPHDFSTTTIANRTPKTEKREGSSDPNHFSPSLGKGRSDKILVPFSNTNTYNTVTQFYIRDMSDLQFINHSLDTLNVNQNNDTMAFDDPSPQAIDCFNSRVTRECAPEPVSVVNLSSRHLSATELQVLSLGKGFCLTPGEPDMGEIKADLDRLHTKCRTKLFFDKLEGDRSIKIKLNSCGPSKSSPDISTTQTPITTGPNQNPRSDGFSANLLREKLFKKPSKWVPPRGPPTIETFALLNELALNKTPIRAPHHQNLDLTARCCLQQLSKDK